jgi:DNA-3-methyladenine glycosylase I
MTTLVAGPDGHPRCGWAITAPEYLSYHDDEWGRELRGDDPLFERLSLEAFQSGLSWITVLRKRAAFRAAFAGFAIDAVAAFDEGDVARLMADAGIVRNRQKIDAVITNARLAATLPGGLSDHLWSFAPPRAEAAPAEGAVPATSEESTALAADLRGRGFRFVGPTTAYALMQAVGMVNDHLEGCVARAGVIEP